jgi:hypothetical protein
MVRLLICTGTDYFFQNGKTCKINQKVDEQSRGAFQQQPPNTVCTPLRHALSGSQGGLVGLCAFSGILRGLELIPAKWRCPAPPTSTPTGHNGHRWAARAEDGRS